MLLVMHMVYLTVAMATGGFGLASMASCRGRPDARTLNFERLNRATMLLFLKPSERPVFRHRCGFPVIGRNFCARFLTTKEQLKTTYDVVLACQRRARERS
jgi:hypothetical protein